MNIQHDALSKSSPPSWVIDYMFPYVFEAFVCHLAISLLAQGSSMSKTDRRNERENAARQLNDVATLLGVDGRVAKRATQEVIVQLYENLCEHVTPEHVGKLRDARKRWCHNTELSFGPALFRKVLPQRRPFNVAEICASELGRTPT